MRNETQRKAGSEKETWIARGVPTWPSGQARVLEFQETQRVALRQAGDLKYMAATEISERDLAMRV